MIRVLKFICRHLVFVIIAIAALYMLHGLIVHPSLDRNWTADQKVLATAEFNGDSVTIRNIRNIDYRTTKDYDVRYYDKTFNLNDIESAWFLVEPFSGHGAGAAHTLVSFGFKGGDYVAISAEIRKEEGESFSPIKGLLRQYEIVYVIADERDVVKLRSNYRKDDVFLYPASTTKENMRAMFVDMLDRANKLATEPEFYNTLTNTCTTNLVAHVNDIVPGRVPFSYKILMPAYSDELARDIGLIDSSLSIEELRAKHKINAKAEQYADSPRFSQLIRQ
jgi:hypothetical protein